MQTAETFALSHVNKLAKKLSTFSIFFFFLIILLVESLNR